MMSAGKLDVLPLITHRINIDEAKDAYDLIGSGRPSLGVLLVYPGIVSDSTSSTVSLQKEKGLGKAVGPTPGAVGFIGAGNYSTSALIPAFKKAGAHLEIVSSQSGLSGLNAAKKFQFNHATTDNYSVITNPDVDAVIITTRHNSHAPLVIEALEAGKHVFVEKPLCITADELKTIKQAYERLSSPPILMVGFNRRFAPQIRKIKELLAGVSGPKSFILTVNAGFVPKDHWTQDPDVGGGRIIGEACHFIDLLRHLAGSPTVSSSVMNMRGGSDDTAAMTFQFADGSLCSLHFFSFGSRAVPFESLEVLCGGRLLQLNNFRSLKGFGWPSFKGLNLLRQDKGQSACAEAFLSAVRTGGHSPIKFEEILEVSHLALNFAGKVGQLS